MASISSFIVAPSQQASPVSGKAARDSKQNQHNPASFGEMLNQTLTTAEGTPEKASTKTAGKSAKGEAHRIKAHAHKDGSEENSATATAVAVASPQISSVLDDMVAARSASEAGLKAPTGTASVKDAGAKTNTAATRAAATAATRAAATAAAVATAATAAATADAPDTANVNEDATAGDTLEIAQATPAHSEHGRMTLQTTNYAAGKAAETAIGRTASQDEAHAADPQIKRGNAQVAAQADASERPDGLTKKLDGISQNGPVNRPTPESALRHAGSAALTQRASQDSEGKTATAAETGNFKLATAAFGVAPSEPVQAASNTSAPTPASLTLAPRVASEEWNNALGKQMVWMAHANQQVAELHLNPQDLGPLKVTLIMNDNHAQVMFTSSHQPVLAAVEAALPQLRTTLAESGINLGNTSVSPESQQQQGMLAQDQSGQQGKRNYQGDDTSVAQAAASIDAPAGPAVIRSNGGAVDIFA